MDADGLIVRPSGEWVKRKHHYLRRYCDMFATSMKGKWSLNYLDLLAGPGACRIRATKELTPGSPFVALEYPFDRFIFYEADADSAAALSAHVAKHEKAVLCTIVQKEWEQVVLEPGFRVPPGLTLAFVDPTGISQAPWSAISALGSAGDRMDILMTIQHGMSINLNRHQYLAKVGETAVDAFLGGNDWRSTLQDSRSFCGTVLDAFTYKMLGLGFMTRKWIIVKNDKGLGLYYLCLFSRHSLALKFWDQVVLKDETGHRTLGL
jgi:three-Cys-motif partner protein